METCNYLLYLALILMCTKFLGLLTRRARMPQVVGALLAGLLHYVPDYESCCNYFIQGHKNIWNMDSDMGNEFSNGNLLPDVLLWSVCKTNF